MPSTSPAGSIAWRLMFRVSRRDKAERELSRLAELLDAPLRASKYERYWKIPELWTCEAETPLEAGTLPELITTCLSSVDRIATGWSIHGPVLGPDGSLQNFDGVFAARRPRGSGARLQSLEWAEFVLISHLSGAGASRPRRMTGQPTSDEPFARGPFDLMRRLDGAGIPYRVGSIREEAILIEARARGSFWEIEFFADQPAVFERFNTDGRILGPSELAALVAKWSDPPRPEAAAQTPPDALGLMRWLREASINFRVDEQMIRRIMIAGAIMIEAAVPGERWEIDLLPDGAIEMERFETEFVHDFGAAELEELLAGHSDGRMLYRKRRGLRW